MKKLFTFLFSALMSVGMWADPNILTPTISGDLSFTESTTVTMECTSPNSDIYYTTDGVTDPRCDCAAAPEYKQPITITETTIIKAAAYDGNDWSAVAEVTFTKVPAPTTYTLELYVNDSTMGSIELVNALKHTGPLEGYEGKLVYEVAEGDSVIIRATANEGYDFKNWKYANDLKNLNWVEEEQQNCYYCGLAADEAELSFEMKEDIAIMAVFEEAQGIENVVLTESAQKVTVDGVLYIVRDGKMYNAQGAQVR